MMAPGGRRVGPPIPRGLLGAGAGHSSACTGPGSELLCEVSQKPHECTHVCVWRGLATLKTAPAHLADLSKGTLALK